ncbi:MAG: NAD-dependent epimerase/dehydratase family protein [Deltaproteobacteria bacterium]|nr:NAD-dependent epimerase/dehydratase family protein [Deltaproteobacteria bacterium]
MAAPARDGGARSVLVTGASGLVGRQVVARLARERDAVGRIVAVDLREPAAADRQPGVVYETGDVREAGLVKRLEHHAADTVVHLAAVVVAGPESSRELEYSIDVLGTRNVIEACVAAGVRQLVYTSSGAAYGYHADNPVPLRETDPLRGNQDFAYAWHKRLAEEAIAEARRAHPALSQLVFRVGTILGARVASPISALFERRVIIGVAGSDAPFVLIWDEDVAAAIAKGILERRAGIYNLCGDGAIALPEIARRLGRPYLPLPAPLLGGALGLARRLGLSSRGAEQVDFLRYRPVLANDALVRELGFRPRFTSSECFDHYRSVRFGSGS